VAVVAVTAECGARGVLIDAVGDAPAEAGPSDIPALLPVAQLAVISIREVAAANTVFWNIGVFLNMDRFSL